jgi:hypothetical protein
LLATSNCGSSARATAKVDGVPREAFRRQLTGGFSYINIPIIESTVRTDFSDWYLQNYDLNPSSSRAVLLSVVDEKIVRVFDVPLPSPQVSILTPVPASVELNYYGIRLDLSSEIRFTSSADVEFSQTFPTRRIGGENFRMSSVPYDLLGTGVVDENQQPVASFTYSPENPMVGEQITFDASSSYDPDGQIVGYYWDFGDGDHSTTQDNVITHAYANAGNYTAALMVTDNEGLTDTMTQNVQVRKCLDIEILDTGSVTIAPGQYFAIHAKITNRCNTRLV